MGLLEIAGAIVGVLLLLFGIWQWMCASALEKMATDAAYTMHEAAGLFAMYPEHQRVADVLESQASTILLTLGKLVPQRMPKGGVRYAEPSGDSVSVRAAGRVGRAGAGGVERTR